MNDTSPNGIHTSNGRFAAGNPGGPGNPHAGQVARLRSAMLEAVTPDDLRAVTRKLVEMALQGDLKAVDLFLTRIAWQGRQRASSGHPSQISGGRNGRLTGAVCGDPAILQRSGP